MYIHCGVAAFPCRLALSLWVGKALRLSLNHSLDMRSEGITHLHVREEGNRMR